MIKTKNIIYLLILYFNFSSNIFNWKYISASDYVYDKYLTGYEYFAKVQKFKFASQGLNLEMAYMYLPSNNKQKGNVTLLHGKNFTSNYWKEIALTLNSLRVIMHFTLFGASSTMSLCNLVLKQVEHMYK
mgnify:CR=1 FL=1